MIRVRVGFYMLRSTNYKQSKPDWIDPVFYSFLSVDLEILVRETGPFVRSSTSPSDISTLMKTVVQVGKRRTKGETNEGIRIDRRSFVTGSSYYWTN